MVMTGGPRFSLWKRRGRKIMAPRERREAVTATSSWRLRGGQKVQRLQAREGTGWNCGGREVSPTNLHSHSASGVQAPVRG